ncbi:hypothetical protein SpAn4DRAFT_3869 [Sporomusa ovata]|uniref:Uncharacterized protein n=2 Tax=Sporomusa ovata TaxID=2378 RepID=A0A0U1KXG3_9FIRM|nr:hypothetical protein SpAn4DRAFT_3869 [Sporomusa ovata]
MEVIDDISRLNKKVAELTARVEQAEGRKKALRDKAILLYEEMKDIQFYNMSSWERRAYAVVQALAGNEEETA